MRNLEQQPWNIPGLLSPTEGWNPARLFDVLLVPVLTACALGIKSRPGGHNVLIWPFSGQLPPGMHGLISSP